MRIRREYIPRDAIEGIRYNSARQKGGAMAEVFATMFQDEALVVRSLIESTGIAAEISSEHFMEVYPIFFPQEGGIKILVAEEDLEDALAVVAQYHDSKTHPSQGAAE
jgi:hypothetical protein